MTSLRRLQIYYYFFTTLYFLTGIGALVLGNVWLAQSKDGQTPREAVISPEIEITGTVIGGFVAITSLVGYVAGVKPIERKKILVVFCWLVLVAILAELALGGVVWFKTLRMRSLFDEKWRQEWPASLKVQFQEMLEQDGYGYCCGYSWNKGDVVSEGICAKNPLEFPGCEEKISAFADGYLRKLFTSLFGFTIVNVFCFITTVILIQARNDEERYIRIGRKEGMFKASI
ncbi:phospholipid scramblase 1 [Actinomortierella ambigua]|uniref:Phospholipid scramblase 1 n=1 Tax=Actinomortierella ambigua TaxID=1343610 RepID=A0A9P6U9V6_9FUNG|nr:phospholipid scramblase 1 [Actinomortierella ambigua]